MDAGQSETQIRFWQTNKNRILKDYDGGFAVIDYLQFRHFKTRDEVYRLYPVLAQEDLFGNRPLLVNIAEEQWSERPLID